MSSLYGNVVANTRTEYILSYDTQEEMMAGASTDGVPAGYTVLCKEDKTIWQKIINSTDGILTQTYAKIAEENIVIQTWTRRSTKTLENDETIEVNEITRNGTVLSLQTVKFINGETPWINLDTGIDSTEPSSQRYDWVFIPNYECTLNGFYLQILKGDLVIKFQLLDKKALETTGEQTILTDINQYVSLNVSIPLDI